MPFSGYPSHLNDAELAQRCTRGDPAAQKALYDRYKNRMMAFCLRYFRRPELAEEFFQEGFIRFFQKIDQYNPAYPLYPYLKTIFLRAGLNYLQQFFSDKHVTDPLPDTLPEQLYELPAQDLPGLEYQEFLTLLNALPAADALILQLCLIEDLPHEEISQMLNISVGNSRIRVLRARKKLIQLITKQPSITPTNSDQP